MSARIMTLTRDDLSRLREVGDAYYKDGDALVRLIRTGSGYSPLTAGDGTPLPGQMVFSTADLDLIERDPAGLACVSADRSTQWTVRMAEVTA